MSGEIEHPGENSAKPVSNQGQGRREWPGSERTEDVSGKKGNQKNELWPDLCVCVCLTNTVHNKRGLRQV